MIVTLVAPTWIGWTSGAGKSEQGFTSVLPGSEGGSEGHIVCVTARISPVVNAGDTVTRCA